MNPKLLTAWKARAAPPSRKEMKQIREAFNRFQVRHGEPTARQAFQKTVIPKTKTT